MRCASDGQIEEPQHSQMLKMDIDQSAEILRLRATVRDLLALSIIPEAWVGREPPAIAADLANLLADSLELDFAFVRLCDPKRCQVAEVTRGSSWKAFPEWLQRHVAAFGQFSRKEIITNVSGDDESSCGVVIPIGVNSERGFVAAASNRSNFPDQIDQQLLSVAANNAATAFQNAFLINELRSAQEALRNNEQELRKARDELEIKVAERTAELQRSAQELQRSEFYVAEGERLGQAGSWALNPSGFFEYWSRELFQIYGLDPQKGAPTLEQYLATIHPQDRDFMAETVKRMCKQGSGCDAKKRIIRPDGAVRHIRCVGIPVLDNGVLKRFLGTAMDVTEQELLTQELERRQAYLAEAQRLTHTGSWAINVRTDEHFWSEEIFRIYEFDPKLKPAWSLIRDRVHPDDRASLDRRRKMEFTQTGWTDSEADLRIIVPDGRIKHLHTIAHPVMDASGQIVEVIGTTMDVTERKRIEDSLRRSESHLAEAQKLTHTGSWARRLVDRKMKTEHLSEEWFRIYGFDPAEGPPTWEEFLEHVHPEDRLEWKGITERAIVEKADYDHEFRILLPNGMVKWIRAVGHPVLSDAGDLEQFVGSSTEITERKSAEQERERMRQLEADLAHTNRVSTLGEMAASLAHEIKQPIAAAITSANSCIEWLAHEPPNLDRARAAAARIDKYGNRAAEIIDRIRSFYKKSPPQRELVDVNGIVQEMLTLLEGEANRYSVAMHTELAAELPKIMADRVQLQQVFMNLMVNGIEAMKDSGGEVTVKSQLQDGQLQFSVSDTGVGLPKEKMEQIFSAFFTTKPQGSGMGLAISRSIVESHGGRLWASANEGRGASFHFTLPTEVS